MKQGITHSEWEVMRVAWSNHNVTNNLIFDVLSEKMNWKMSTIKTLVRRLTEKGYLKAEKQSREYTYSPRVSQDEVFKESGDELLDQICTKRVGGFLTQFVQEREMSQADLEKLKEIIEHKQETAPQSVTCQCVPGQCNC